MCAGVELMRHCGRWLVPLSVVTFTVGGWGRARPRRHEKCIATSAVRVWFMAILVTVSLNLAESVSLRELRHFVETAEGNRVDVDADLREYDENSSPLEVDIGRLATA
jgi:hypothetical protein